MPGEVVFAKYTTSPGICTAPQLTTSKSPEGGTYPPLRPLGSAPTLEASRKAPHKVQAHRHYLSGPHRPEVQARSGASTHPTDCLTCRSSQSALGSSPLLDGVFSRRGAIMSIPRRVSPFADGVTFRCGRPACPHRRWAGGRRSRHRLPPSSQGHAHGWSFRALPGRLRCLD